MIDFYSNDTVVNIPPQEYLIDKILPEGMTLLAAAPKAGKSILALDWALSLSAGLDWMGIPSRQTSVLYILSEARSTLPPRVKAWQHRHGKLASEITYACGATDLCNAAQVVSDLAPHIPEDGLIIWDTTQRNMNGADENDVRAMGSLIKTCDSIYESYGTSNLLVHHSTKEHEIGAARTKVTASWYRGHSSLLGAVDMGMTIEEEHLVCKAPRHDEEFEPIPLVRAKEAGSVLLDWHSKKPRGGYR